MIELDRNLEPVCKAVNKCSQELFPHLPQFPQFSFTRAMITIWRKKVYSKLSELLLSQFGETLMELRNENFAMLVEREHLVL